MKDQSDKAGASSHAERKSPSAEMNGEAPANTASPHHEANVTVVNKRGLHARAAAKFVKLAGEFQCDVCVTAAKGGFAAGAVVSGRSIMGLMMLAAGPGCVLHIEADGGDADAALTALVSLIEEGFDEKD
jgi:phosphocarrier protein